MCIWKEIPFLPTVSAPRHAREKAKGTQGVGTEASGFNRSSPPPPGLTCCVWERGLSLLGRNQSSCTPGEDKSLFYPLPQYAVSSVAISKTLPLPLGWCPLLQPLLLTEFHYFSSNTHAIENSIS